MTFGSSVLLPQQYPGCTPDVSCFFFVEQIFQENVEFDEDAQTGGSRDIYEKKVDRSEGKREYGDNARRGGTHNDSKFH